MSPGPGSIKSTALLLVFAVGLNAAGGLYRRSAITRPVQMLVSMAGRALVAGALATSVRVLLEMPVRSGVLYSAGVFFVLAAAGRLALHAIARTWPSVAGFDGQ